MPAVRDGKIVAVTCPECGCRLKEFDNWGYSEFAHYTLPHDVINGHATKDARGHICSFLNTPLVQLGNTLKSMSSNYVVTQFGS